MNDVSVNYVSVNDVSVNDVSDVVSDVSVNDVAITERICERLNLLFFSRVKKKKIKSEKISSKNHQSA
mgnify:CR=1 FL=1